MTVYLLHFKQPYKHARHYVGFAKRLDERLEHHRNGTGARLMQVIRDAGIDWQLARTWPQGDRNFERAIKNRKASPRLCPICNPGNRRATEER